jgi:hypothetical protein
MLKFASKDVSTKISEPTCVFLSCVFINFIFVFLTSGQDCNSGMHKQMHFRTDMEHNICRPVNNSDVSLGYQLCTIWKQSTYFELYSYFQILLVYICKLKDMLTNLNAGLHFLNSEIKMEKYSARLLSPSVVGDCFNMNSPQKVLISFFCFIAKGT